jgi:hypothetical protein
MNLIVITYLPRPVLQIRADISILGVGHVAFRCSEINVDIDGLLDGLLPNIQELQLINQRALRWDLTWTSRNASNS